MPIPASVETPGLPLDKVAHLCEYLLFAWCLARSGRASRWPAGKIRAAALPIAVGLGATLEGVQAFLPYRSAEWMDLVANVIGTALGLWVSERP